jgi:putative exporter of polyketide antibiotics
LVHLVVGPTDRGVLLGGRLALGAAGIVVASVLAGLAAWAGAKTQGIDLGLTTMTRSGLNVAPTALVVLGIGALTVAVAPRAAVRSVYVVVAGWLVIDLLSSLVESAHWLAHVSLFHYMALAPAQDLDARTITITLAIALVLGGGACFIFRHRDLRTA